MDKQVADVVIVGGGPVGMGLAIELGQRGVTCVVVERHVKPQLNPNFTGFLTFSQFHCYIRIRKLLLIMAAFCGYNQ